MTIPSPCINVCRMNDSLGWCEGCGRSIDEIAAWGGLDDRAKWLVCKQLPARKQRLEAALFDAAGASTPAPAGPPSPTA